MQLWPTRKKQSAWRLHENRNALLRYTETRAVAYLQADGEAISGHQRKAYEANVQALWALPHREEKYAALEYAFNFPDFTDTKSIPLYESLIRDGAWWDFVDPLAINLVGHAFLKDRATITNIMKKWTEDQDMWIRRSSIICQNHHKKQTDERLLLETCLKLAHEKEFFIRKAIGWALREYSYTAPNAVARFSELNRDKLSNLSYREATKRLVVKPSK